MKNKKYFLKKLLTSYKVSCIMDLYQRQGGDNQWGCMKNNVAHIAVDLLRLSAQIMCIKWRVDTTAPGVVID